MQVCKSTNNSRIICNIHWTLAAFRTQTNWQLHLKYKSASFWIMQISSAFQLVTSSFESNCIINLHFKALNDMNLKACASLSERGVFTQFSFYFLDKIFGCSFNYLVYWWLSGRWVQYQYVRVNNFCLREVLIIVPLSWAGENDMAVVMGLECVLVKAWNAGILKIAVYEEQLLAQLLIMTDGKRSEKLSFLP